MDPINYLAQLQRPDIAGSLMSGLQAGQSINDVRYKQALQEAKLQKEQQAAGLAEQYRNDLESAFANPSSKSFAMLKAKYPQQIEAIKQAWDTLSQGEKDAQFLVGAQAYNAISSGNVDAAKTLLDSQIEARKNAGEDASGFETMRNALDTDPKMVANTLGLSLAAIDPERWTKMASEMREQEKAPAELGMTKAQTENLYSQIDERAGRLALDKDKFRSDVEMKLADLNQKKNPSLNLDKDAKKIINESSANAVSSEMSANQMTDLASKFEQAGGGSGKFSGLNEYAKSAIGAQDYMSKLRQQYVRIRAGQVMKMLPPGSASDVDVQNAMRGFPPETADAKFLASFLRGMAKLEKMNSSIEDAKSEWVNSVGHLGKPPTDIEVNGMQVPAGTTFTAFAKNYLNREFGRASGQTGSQAGTEIQGRSYMRFAGGGQ